jgi:hypothetical protein
VFFNLKPGSELRRAILLIATLGGGTSGALLCIGGLGRAGSGRATLAILLLCALYALGIAAGLRLYKDAGKSMRLAAPYLALQIPVVQASAFTYKFWAVAAYAISFYPTSVAFDTSWFIGTYWELAVFGPAREFGIGINVVPIVLLSLLLSKHDGQSLGRSA